MHRSSWVTVTSLASGGTITVRLQRRHLSSTPPSTWRAKETPSGTAQPFPSGIAVPEVAFVGTSGNMVWVGRDSTLQVIINFK